MKATKERASATASAISQSRVSQPRRTAIAQPTMAPRATVSQRPAVEKGIGVTLARNQVGQMTARRPRGRAIVAPRSERRSPSQRASGAKAQVTARSVRYQRTVSGIQDTVWL